MHDDPKPKAEGCPMIYCTSHAVRITCELSFMSKLKDIYHDIIVIFISIQDFPYDVCHVEYGCRNAQLVFDCFFPDHTAIKR